MHTDCRRPDMYELNQDRTVPERPKSELMWLIRMEWSTVSQAANWSSFEEGRHRSVAVLPTIYNSRFPDTWILGTQPPLLRIFTVIFEQLQTISRQDVKKSASLPKLFCVCVTQFRDFFETKLPQNEACPLFRGHSFSELWLQDAINRSRRARYFSTQVSCHREVQGMLLDCCDNVEDNDTCTRIG